MVAAGVLAVFAREVNLLYHEETLWSHVKFLTTKMYYHGPINETKYLRNDFTDLKCLLNTKSMQHLSFSWWS